jgi:hypothetical protein
MRIACLLDVKTRLTPFRVTDDIPSPPCVIPSDTPIVLNCHPIIPCFCTASFTIFPRLRTEIRVVNEIPNITVVKLTVHTVTQRQSYSLISQNLLTCRDFPPTDNAVSYQTLEGDAGGPKPLPRSSSREIKEEDLKSLGGITHPYC